ncbi:mannosyltransferase [Exophiala xenobiotica]|nr:mannosyltransferase [Exophiala xenobiotica]
MPAVMPMRSRRSILYALGVMTFVVYTLYLWNSPPRALPPMPGTYQHFSEINFEYHTHSFGAISHCDPRFAPSQPPGIEETKKTLSALMKSYAATMRELRAETWIAHGTLLGWHWNQKFLPWDNDIDVQMSVETLAGLAPHNMSEYHHPVAGEERPRVYLLDINPHYTIASTRDVANKIDARWIDTTNGKYVDITAVHVSPGKSEHIPFDQGVFFCKDGHRYRSEELFPLQDASFEGISVKVPYDSDKILSEEYGKKSLTNTRYHWYAIVGTLFSQGSNFEQAPFQ